MSTPKINNHLYDELGDRWYTADDHPIALLRAENALRNPWVAQQIETHLGSCSQDKRIRVLDIGCGGGFLANDLAARGFQVVGIDASVESLRIAQERDETRSVQYQVEDAYQVSFDANTFDVVCAMDFLEHVQYPDQVILEASRVLKPGGCFFFHTFNRNLISGLLAIRCVEWFVKNTPKDLHLLRYFIKPSEIVTACKAAGMNVIEMRGVTPQLFSWSVLKGLVTGRVPKDFKFRFSSSLFIGYCGFAKKNGDQGFKLD